MKIFPPHSVVCFIAICFLVLSTFSFGVPVGDDPHGIDPQDGNQQQQIQKARARVATDRDGSGNGDEEIRGSGCPAIAENDEADQNKPYLSREGFVACLAADVEKFSQQLKFSQYLTSAGEKKEQVQQRKLQEGVFLKKIIKTANRLSAKYISAGKGNEQRVMTPSIREMQAKGFFILNSEGTSYDLDAPWPTKEMTHLEMDQEYYEAFKQKETEALQFLAQDQTDEAFYCHNIAFMLDRLSECLGSSQEPDDSDEDDSRFIEVSQQSISLSLLLKSPEQIKAMTGEEQRAELLLFQAVTEIQRELQNKKKAFALLSVVQQYRAGDLQGNPHEFCVRYNNSLEQPLQSVKADQSVEAESQQKSASPPPRMIRLNAMLESRSNSSRPIFNQSVCDVLFGSFFSISAVIIAYELYLDLLPAKSHAASS